LFPAVFFVFFLPLKEFPFHFIFFLCFTIFSFFSPLLLLLSLKSHCTHITSHGEVGRFKLKQKGECRMIGFWCRLLNGRRSKLSFLLFMLLKTLYDKEVLKPRWIEKLKHILDDTGFSYLWGCTDVVNDKYIKAAVEMRISDILRQSWKTEISNNSLYKLQNI
ncbi:hypothetical protein LDENG_00207060, partial [Lucifuga dentata]